MQKEDFRFRLNKEVVVMLVVIMMALALPLFAIIFGLNLYLHPKPEVREEAPEEKALREALLQVSEKAWPMPELSPETVRLDWSASDLAAERRAVEDAAHPLGGAAVLMEETGGMNRIVVTIPSGKTTEFLSKLGKSDQNGLPKGALQGSGAIFEITLRKSSP